ncbi:hypothetical protein BGZ98_001841, partial [Dissophora globulifera]
MQEVRSFVRDAVSAFNSKDTDGVCNLIMLDEGHDRLEQLQQALYNMTEESIRSTVEAEMKKGPQDVKDFITKYLLFTIASGVETSRMADVYELLVACYLSFLTLFQAQDGGWLTPLLMSLSHSLIGWALFADDEQQQQDDNLRQSGKPALKKREPKIREAASQHLSKAFSIAANDRSPEASKKTALFYLANQMLRVYFKAMQTLMNNVRNAKVNLAEYPMSEQVTYQYYVGRYHLYQSNLRDAERELAFAFNHRPPLGMDEHENRITYGNTRLILIYLTACRLCLGRLPSYHLLAEYGLDRYFQPLVDAVKTGHLGKLEAAWEDPASMSWFVSREIYLLLKQKLPVLCWRSLIRRTCLASRGPNDPPQMRVDLEALLHVVRKLTGDDTFDIWDVECITASLLDQA